MTDHVLATYLLESPHSAEQAAEMLAGEMSTGTFIPVPGETEVLKERYRTKVVSVEPLEESPTPAFSQPAALMSNRYSRARVTVAIPTAMVGSTLTTLLSSVLGNIYELKEASALRLMDLQLPEAFLACCALPRFSVRGTRELAGVHGRPLIGAVVKPSVGLTPEGYADATRLLAKAGVDFMKDDELMADPPYCPFSDRVAAIQHVLDEHAQRTGRRVLYAFNITGPVDAMMRRHDEVQSAGGACVQININQAGIAAVAHLRTHGALAIHGHGAGWGQTSRQPWFGIDFGVYQLIWRLTGVDHLVVVGPDSKFWPPNDAAMAAMRACLTPLRDESDRLMPAVGSRQWGGQAPQIAAGLDRPDLIYLAGAGIFGHPGGPAEGIEALRAAWDAALAGVSLAEAATTHPALARSLAAFTPDNRDS